MMTVSFLEVVSFHLLPDVGEEAFRAATRRHQDELDRVPGFLGRCIAPVEPGSWIDVVAWSSSDAHTEAMASLPDQPASATWMALMDPASIVMHGGRADGGSFAGGGCLEIVLGALDTPAAAAAAQAEVPGTTAVLAAMAGYRSRVTAVSAEGLFLDAVWWSDPAAAQAAAAAFLQLPAARDFCAQFTAATRMHHLVPRQ